MFDASRSAADKIWVRIHFLFLTVAAALFAVAQGLLWALRQAWFSTRNPLARAAPDCSMLLERSYSVIFWLLTLGGFYLCYYLLVKLACAQTRREVTPIKRERFLASRYPGWR